MSGRNIDLEPDWTPEIRQKGGKMLGVHIPALNPGKLIGAQVAVALGTALLREGARVEQTYEACKLDADEVYDELKPGANEAELQLLREQRKEFIFEAMCERLGIDEDDDLDLDEDYMEDQDAQD